MEIHFALEFFSGESSEVFGPCYRMVRLSVLGELRNSFLTELFRTAPNKKISFQGGAVFVFRDHGTSSTTHSCLLGFWSSESKQTFSLFGFSYFQLKSSSHFLKIIVSHGIVPLRFIR